MVSSRRRQQREEAFNRAGTGQFGAGDLSRQPTQGTSRTVAPSVPSRFVTLPNGRTGTLIDQPRTDLSRETPAFEEKRKGAFREELSKLAPALVDLQNASIPKPQLQSPLLDQPGSQAATLASQDLNQSKGLLEKVGNVLNTKVSLPTNAVFNVLEGLGNGDAQRGLFSVLTLPLTAGSTFAIGKVGINGQVQQVSRLGTEGLVKNAASTSQKIASNTKTAKQSAGWIAKLLSAKKGSIIDKVIAISFGTWFVSEVVGTYPFANTQETKALETLHFAYAQARKNNDVQGMKDAIAMRKEFSNPALDGIARNVPWGNIQVAVKKLIRAEQLQLNIDERQMNNLALKNQLGMSDADLRKLEFEQEQTAFDEHRQKNRELDAHFLDLELQARKKASDEFNEEKLKTEEKVLKLKETAGDLERIQRRNVLEQEAEFWAEQRRLRREEEAREREEIARFWFEYRKQAAKFGSDNTPSKLGFGLFR